LVLAGRHFRQILNLKFMKPDLLPHRLNFDAIVFCGCTMKEMQTIATICLTICILFLGLFTKWLLNMFLLGVGLSFPVAVGLTWCIAQVLQKYKQGKPKGYVKQKLMLWFEDLGLWQTPYVRRSGAWSIGKIRKN
jgi:conjugative transfer region protein (TIGR03750 family)